MEEYCDEILACPECCAGNKLRLLLNTLEGRIHTRLQSLFGRPDENTSIAARVNEAVGSLNDLMIDPASSVRRSAFLATMQDMASGFANLSEELMAESRVDNGDKGKRGGLAISLLSVMQFGHRSTSLQKLKAVVYVTICARP